jgi:hypothetical protein
LFLIVELQTPNITDQDHIEKLNNILKDL